MFFKFGRPVTAGVKQSRVAGQYAGQQPSSGSSPQSSMYNAKFDRLSVDMLDDILPSDQTELQTTYSKIYAHDGIAGPAIDLIANLPFSDFNITCEDKEFEEIATKTCNSLDIQTLMPEIMTEFLMRGRAVGSLIFDDNLGIFTDFIGHDVDLYVVTPIPVRNVDPKIDLRNSPAWRQFVASNDPRDLEVKTQMPQKFLQIMSQGGNIPLDPLTTLWLPRRTTITDRVGTSLLTRILPFWALEKNLFGGTIVAARRRRRAILHVECGVESTWEPEAEEMDSIAGLFISADDDPDGAVVVTRSGVVPNEIRQANDFWKISEEGDWLANSKMRALGINEAFLSGDASYNNMETALSVFVESIKALRQAMTTRIFYNKIFPTLARVHGFVKRTPAQMQHRIHVQPTPQMRSVDRPTYNQSIKYNKEDLICPTLHWAKQLQPVADNDYIDILKAMKEEGLPIPLKVFGAHAGVDVDKILEMLGEDAKLRKQIKDFKQSLGEPTGGDENAGDSFAGYSATPIKSLPIWNKDGRFVDLSRADAVKALGWFTETPERRAVLKDSEEMLTVLRGQLGSDRKARLMTYVLDRLGLAQAVFDEPTFQSAMLHVAEVNQEADPKKAMREVVRVRNRFKKKASAKPSRIIELPSNISADNASKVCEQWAAKHDPLELNNPHIYSGR
jgi:hypothetical protein